MAGQGVGRIRPKAAVDLAHGELFVGVSTVKTHVASLMNKLGARNRVEIAMWAYDTRRV